MNLTHMNWYMRTKNWELGSHLTPEFLPQTYVSANAIMSVQHICIVCYSHKLYNTRSLVCYM